MKRLVQSGGVTEVSQNTVVFESTSAGVSPAKIASGTTGWLAGSIWEKSPLHSIGCGSVLDFTFTGETVQSRSYAAKNHVFPNFGIGPPIEAPRSVILKKGLGNLL